VPGKRPPQRLAQFRRRPKRCDLPQDPFRDSPVRDSPKILPDALRVDFNDRQALTSRSAGLQAENPPGLIQGNATLWKALRKAPLNPRLEHELEGLELFLQLL